MGLEEFGVGYVVGVGSFMVSSGISFYTHMVHGVALWRYVRSCD